MDYLPIAPAEVRFGVPGPADFERTMAIAALHIRDAVAADDPTVGELLVRAFEAQNARKLPGVVTPAARLADLRDQAGKRAHGTVLVAELGGRAVGTVALFAWGSPLSRAFVPGAADLRLLAVDADHHGQGLSAALLDAAEARARGLGATAVCLHMRREADGLARLYRSRGYRRDPSGDLDLLPEVFLDAYALRL